MQRLEGLCPLSSPSGESATVPVLSGGPHTDLAMRVCILLIFTLLNGCFANEKQTVSAEPPYEAGAVNPPQCSASVTGINADALLNAAPCHRLSEYGLFIDPSEPRLHPRAPGIIYRLNSTLFSDHARKYRWLFLPTSDGEVQPAHYSAEGPLDFPVGTVLVKVFALPSDTSDTDLDSEEIVEVRLLIHRADGWLGLPYRWHAELGDGYFLGSGDTLSRTLVHDGLTIDVQYSVPTYGSCRTCHNDNGQMVPIGPKARHLNSLISVPGATPQNQLSWWSDQGLLQELPVDISHLPLAPDWRDATARLQDRAKAYLDINCAHCHSDNGAAALSGLRLEYFRTSIDYTHGVCNSAHGWRGGGFDIWPGRGEDSSLPLRMELNGAADRMPPLGRSVADGEAVELIRRWIDSLPATECGSG